MSTSDLSPKDAKDVLSAAAEHAAKDGILGGMPLRTETHYDHRNLKQSVVTEMATQQVTQLERAVEEKVEKLIREQFRELIGPMLQTMVHAMAKKEILTSGEVMEIMEGILDVSINRRKPDGP